MLSRFEFGESVRVIRNVRNDGTYPGMEMGDMLIKRGSVGYVQNVGTFLQDQIIYSVHFMDVNKIIGCRDEELIAETDPWIPGRFEYRDKVTSNRILVVNGEVIARPGDVAEVLKMVRDATETGLGEIQYHVRFPGRTLQVAETMLEPADEQVSNKGNNVE